MSVMRSDPVSEVASKRIIVQKFGGTSVSTEERRKQAVNKVIRAKMEGYSPVVVVSAMGRKGEPYATDSLLELVGGINGGLNGRELDLLLACGEVISTVIVVRSLREAGYDAVGLTGAQAGIVTDDNFGDARILGINPERILRHLARGEIVVVAGFQGSTQQGDITTLGRGGSDTTATALGVALKAELVEIYSDVDGVMSVDPRIVPEARTLSMLNYDEICEMAYNGAKVLHPRAIEIARDGRIPVKVRSTFTEGGGTLITNGKIKRVITGIANLGGLARIEVILPQEAGFEGNGEPGARVRVFKVVSSAGINVDFINILPDRAFFTVRGELTRRVVDILSREGFEARAIPGCAKVSVIGAGMQEVPGIMARVMEALHKAGVNVIQTVDSEITISCLIEEKDMEVAVRALFKEFNLESTA